MRGWPVEKSGTETIKGDVDETKAKRPRLRVELTDSGKGLLYRLLDSKGWFTDTIRLYRFFLGCLCPLL
jgi:hypothetical protein